MDEACLRAPAVVAAIRDFGMPAPIVRVSLHAPTAVLVDLSSKNQLLSSVDPSDCAALDRVLRDQLQSAGATCGIGGYGERRSIYSRGEQFGNSDGEVRCIHLGVDVWLPSGQEIFSPFKATIHSFQNNDLPGDYGPTLILQHDLQGTTFYTLYGHLSPESLDGKAIGQAIEHGEKIACIGSPPVNGDWPPHLHFQIIVDMLGKSGDFPGVASQNEQSVYLQICPDPNLVLQSTLLR
jgi:murein DD-endopeptidase MepM/ murein hydrolase activator NlpD